MLTPHVEKFHSFKPPLDVFRSLYEKASNAFFLDSIHDQPPDQKYSYLGATPFLELTIEGGKLYVRGEERGVYPEQKFFEVLRRILNQYRVSQTSIPDFFTGGASGYMSYEMADRFERIRFRSKPRVAMPKLYLGFYRDLIIYDHRNGHYWLSVLADRKDKPKRIKARIQALQDSLSRLLLNPLPASWSYPENFRADMSKSQFIRMVQKAKQYIAAGDIYQANLSQRFCFDYSGSPLKLYSDLREINPSPFASFLKIGNAHIISSSPERLVRKKGRRCETRPIAGTRPRDRFHLSSKAAEQDLLRNKKERAEHIMLVDLERNDLGRVCDFRSVRVEEMMSIERYSHVVHIVSKVTGRLSKAKDGLDLLQAMFPGGTVTGCPKVRCMEIIDELEPVQRGLYTGSIGFLDFRGDLDWNIVIRTLLLKETKGYLQVGAGIVHDSDPVREYEETLHKGEALVSALAQA